MRCERQAADQKRAAEGNAGAADRTLWVNTRSGSCAGGPEREATLNVMRNNVAPTLGRVCCSKGQERRRGHGVSSIVVPSILP